MNRYDKGKIIGSGTFGSVYLIRSKLSRQTFVLKEVNLSSFSESEQQQARNEVSVLSKLKHRHIVRYKEAYHDHEKMTLSIIMEYAESGDLYTAIVRQNGVPFGEHRIITWFVEICLALQYIHHKHILHRDLKSQNVFLTRNKVVKIGDFGISRILKDPEELAKTAIGTPYYLSPEIVDRQPYNYKTDIWSLGCVLFEMAALEQAFQAVDLFHLMAKIKNGLRRELPSDCSRLIQDLVSSLLQIDPTNRPSTEEILSNPALQPSLSEYVINENLQASHLASNLGSTTESLSSRKGAACNTILKELRDGSRRRASLSSVTPKETKRTIPVADQRPERFRYQPSTSSANRYQRPGPSQVKNRAENPRQKPYLSYKPPTRVQDAATQSSFTVSCDTYEVPTNAVSKLNLTRSENPNLDPNLNLTRSENPNLDEDLDSGYQTTENKNLVPKESETYCKKPVSNAGFATFNCKKLLSRFSFRKRVNDEANSNGVCSEASTRPSTDTCPKFQVASACVGPSTDSYPKFQVASACVGPSTDTYPKFQVASACVGPSMDTYSKFHVASGHDHCQHSQCHQCVLDMLWRNRIRCTSVDTAEYSGLKDKLMKVFKKDLFNEVYKALFYDWEGTDIATSKGTFQGVLKNLTYEQVQSLPLMMQLIQLDVFMKSRH